MEFVLKSFLCLLTCLDCFIAKEFSFLSWYKSKRMSRSLCVPKHLAICLTDMVFFYSVAFYLSWEDILF